MTTSTTVFNDADECRNCGARYDQHAIITELCMTGDNCFVPVINGDDELARLQGELLHSNGDLARLRADLQTVTNSRDSYQRDAEILRTEAATMRTDWSRLNGHLNDYADEHDMCDQYDETLADWNSGFRELQLVGREKDYDVSVRVTVVYDVTVNVTASTERQARDQVSERGTSWSEWRDDCGGWPDDLDYDIGDVERG